MFMKTERKEVKMEMESLFLSVVQDLQANTQEMGAPDFTMGSREELDQPAWMI